MSISWGEVGLFIDGAGLAHLATSDSTGGPHVSVVFAVREGDRLTLTTRRSSKKARNLRSDPRAALMWQGNGAETYVWGEVELIDDQTEKSRVWNAGLFPFDLGQFFGSEDALGWLVVHVHPSRAVVVAQTDSGLERSEWRLQSE